MEYEVTQDKKPFNLYASGVEAILQNIYMILTTPKGSIPLDRMFGIDMSSLDMPIEIAENLMTSQILEALQTYEPRATLMSASFEQDHILGRLKVKVKVKINESE